MNESYCREIEHTADLGIELKAKSLTELYSLAAKGYYALSIGSQSAEITEKTELIMIEGGTITDLLITFLNELNFYLMTRNQVYLDFDDLEIIESKNHFKMITKCKIGKITPNMVINEIKAATYHQLKITKRKEHYYTRVYFDV